MNVIYLLMMVSAYIKPRQRVTIREIPAGRVLDIGGGGEGVISQIGGPAVVSIDKLLSEIREAIDKAPHSDWLTADAIELPFGDQSMDNATAFFSCMYMPNDKKEKMFQETWRVLKKGGEIWIWDACMAAKHKAHAVRLGVDLLGRNPIKTSYGVRAKDQSAAGMASLLTDTGFKPEIVIHKKHWFMIKGIKVG